MKDLDSMDSDDCQMAMHELKCAENDLQNALETVSYYLKSISPHLYEQWKAGGFLTSNDVVSMYPTASTALATLNEELEERRQQAEEAEGEEL